MKGVINMADVKGINFNSLSLEQLNRADVTDNEKSQIISIFNDVDNKEDDEDRRQGFISGNALRNFYSRLASTFGKLKIVDLVVKIRDTYTTDDTEKAKIEKVEAREKELDAFVANRKARSKEDNQAEAKRILTEYGDTFDFKNREQTIDFAGMALISKDSDLLLKALEVIMPFASNNSSDNNDKITDVINLRSAIIKQLYDNETQKEE